jgi:hypothetical protein
MHKIALVIYSKLEGSGRSAVYRSMMFADELTKAGDDVVIIFDGAGSHALAEMIKPESDLNGVWTKAAAALRGVCSYCAKAYGVKDALEAAGIPMLTDDHGHASLRAMLNDGRQIITF